MLAAFPGVGLAGSFVDATSTAVPGSGGNLPGGKAAWADYNNDGLVDLHVGNQLLRNKGDGTFASTTVSHGEPIWGDYDNDGFVDLFDYSSGKLWHNNRGDGFSAVTTLADMPASCRGATWGDFNGDGYLDLYVGGYEKYPDAYYPDVIYTNNRNGTFTKTWTQAQDAVTTRGRARPARGVTSADWDQDGDIDIYVSNYRLEPNALWQNNGRGTFTDVAGAKNALATSPGYYGGHSIGAVWGDFNNDGLIDLFAGNFAHNDAGRQNQPQSRFLRNRGPSAGYAFEDMGNGGVFYQESYASPTVGDIDNDGDLDLYITTVYPTASFGVPNYPILFRNDGNFHFTDVTAEWGLPKSGSVATYQAAFADYDNDGYLDLVTNGKLYRNAGGANHYLKVRFDGGPLRDATVIGTQVRIGLNGQTLTRQVEGAVGEGNQNDQTLHFGLGSYTGPLTLQIRWPNGALRILNVPAVDRTITVSVLKPGEWVSSIRGRIGALVHPLLRIVQQHR
jgi:enediyne biosynthesis protein E4